jgi:RNA polymerase sigma factor (sigma-70 family)
MPSTESFHDLMSRLGLGDHAAAAAVHQRFVCRLVALAHTQFETWARAKADHEDVVQSAFQSFFEHCGRREFELVGWDALWSLLALITVRKCRDRRKRLGARRRSAARERPWADAVACENDAALLDREPTPEQAAMLTETLVEWLRSLVPAERAIVELGLQGLDDAAVARRLSRSQRTVRRVRFQVEERLKALCQSEPAR